MTNEEIIKIATEQSAEDIGCKAEDFFSNKNVVVPFKLGKNAKNTISNRLQQTLFLMVII